MKKKASTGYMVTPTFSEIKEAVKLIPDCNETDIVGLMELGLINQSQYEDLMDVVHCKGDTFKTAPYDNMGYYRQQGPLMPSQTTASAKTRLKKVADGGGYSVNTESENKPMYYLDVTNTDGNYASLFDIQGISPLDINSKLVSQFGGLDDGTKVYFLDQQKAQDAANWLLQQINSQG